MRPLRKALPAYLPELFTTHSSPERGVIHRALIDALGNYCSYCEMPLSGYHIEHLRHFAEWPEQLSFSQWDDLLLICNDCRCHIRVPVLNELSAAAILWPDRDMSFSLRDSPLAYELRRVKYVVMEGEERISEEMRDLVFVVANPAADNLLYQKAFNTILHFQLNMDLEYYDVATNELRVPLNDHLARADNRMFKRTNAWFEAEASVENLRAIEESSVGTSNAAAMRKSMIDLIAMTAWYSGNWSVWMTVFYERTGDIELMRAAFAGDVHVFAGLNNENNGLFRTK